ncbi:MAG: metal ABC transporter permease [Treponema sp.]|jgi:zinc transport system permease protein|nr:metal ABC transporter permease [Treponema sp.]
MFIVLTEMFSFTFLVRAFIVGALVSVCAALLGVSLVLKRYSMIGDGLSHVGFGTLALATALNMAPLTISIPIVIAAAFLLLRLSENSKIKGDAAIAIISTGSLAAGVLIISMTTGMNTDVCNYLFGSILAMNRNDVYLSIGLSVTVLVLFVAFYNKLFAITFDETFAKAAGAKTGLYNMLIAVLTAVTIVLGMRMMGAMLISSLIIFPALASMRIFKRFKTVTVCSACISILCFFAGIIVSYLYATPTGASVVMINIFVFLLFWILSALRQHLKINTYTKKPGLSGSAAAVLLVLLVLSFAACSNYGAFAAKKNKAGTLAVVLPGGSFSGENTDAAPSEALQAQVPEYSAEFRRSEAGPEQGAGNDSLLDTALVEIKEKMFIAQTNDIYLNAEDYLGKTIRLEGLFKMEQYEGQEAPYCFVLRYGPGCCGNDGNAGFEVAWDSASAVPYPGIDEWVEAMGKLKYYEEDGYPYLYIALSSLKVLEERGAEFVTQ